MVKAAVGTGHRPNFYTEVYAQQYPAEPGSGFMPLPGGGHTGPA